MKNTCKYVSILGSLLAIAIGLFATILVSAEAPEKSDRTIKLADGKLQLTAPGNWVRKKPSNNIIDAEFAIPASEDDPRDGRAVVAGGGGGVEANINRWIGQFTQPDGSQTKNQAETKQMEVAEAKVHLVDVMGTFKDTGGQGPNAPAVERENYRMLGVIVETPKLGIYFLRFYGPQRTVADNEKAFMKMIQGMEKK